MIRVNIKYKTMTNSGHEAIRETEWVQRGQTIHIEDLEHDHFANYIMTDEIEDADDIMWQNEMEYGKVVSMLEVSVTMGNWPSEVTA